MNAMKRAADDARATLKAAWRCWAAWRALLNGELSRDDTVPSTATLGEIENRTSALDASTSLLDRSLDEAGGAFESIAREPYDAGPVQAGSAHRAVLKLAQFYLDESRLLLDEYLSGDPPIRWVGEDELRRQFAFRLQHLVDVDEFDRNRLGAELEWERAKVGQAPAADPEPSPEVVDVGDETDELLGSLSGELSGKPREVLNYLAKRRRRSVSIDELRREVWRDASGIVDEHDTKAVRTAVSALRTELRRLDRAALAEQIRWNGTGYTLS